MTAEEVIRLLGLAPHPAEGGWFVETWRSMLELPGTALPPELEGARAAGTAIYFLLTPASFSRLHRLRTDEVFHHYLGDAVEMLLLEPAGSGRVALLGPDLAAGQRPQVVVPAGTWQGSRLLPGGAWALLGTTMAPGFDFADYEAGDRAALLAAFPAFAERIEALTP